jgi:hypothetical protein
MRLISDLQDDKYVLITDSQDIQAVCEYLGISPKPWGCLFVVATDGDYDEVYGCEWSVPLLTHPVLKLK